MANKNADSSSQPPPVQPNQQQPSGNEQQDQDQHGDTCGFPPGQSGNPDPRSRGGNTVFKSGPLSISSKGLGWTTWKKRWFILTRTSLVFFRSDPSAVQQKGSEVNLTLGGIDLNNSGSVVVKADKKLLTVLFPDGRDGRAFTLKADTLEDLNEWKSALENALTLAPSASHVMGQNGIFRNDHSETPPDVDEKKEETPTKSTVIGRPVLLALVEVDGSPSFLEKALRFVEDHGSKIEGILRQAADVDDVEHRIREYEQGRNEFTPGEDSHVIADCLKYVLRELPSSPVPASCCNALLDACRTDRGNRVNAMRAAISESFPEPNRRLLQRILTMMQIVASNKNVNRMNTNAVAACMAPLLLRPLLAGDCEIENDFDVGGDGSMQLLQAAAAANHAQAIVITLLEEYESIFGEGSLSPGLYSDSEESGSGTEEGSDDEEYDDDDDDDDDGSQGSDDYTDEEEYIENESNGSYSESDASDDDDGDDIAPDDHKVKNNLSSEFNGNLRSESKTGEGSRQPKVTKSRSSSFRRSSLPRHDDEKEDENVLVKSKGADNKEVKAVVDVSNTEDNKSSTSDVASSSQKPSILTNAPGGSKKNWGRTGGNKKLSMESIDFSAEMDGDDADIERLESAKLELQERISEEVKSNAVLQANLERRKKALYARRRALERDVERLQEQLQQERDRKSSLEGGLNMSKGKKPITETTDENLKQDLEEVAQAAADIAKLENKVDYLENRLGQHELKASGSSNESRKNPEHNAKMKDKQKETEAAATHISERSMLKDGQGTGRENEIEKQQDSRGKSSQSDMSRGGSSKLAGMSKKSSAKGEGATSATSALSKMSMRLNFLKERRSQIANELLNMDIGRSPGVSPGVSPGPGLPSPSSGQNRGSESLRVMEKGSSSNQNQNQDKNKNKNRDKNQDQNNNTNQNRDSDKSKHQNQDSDRGRSENGGDRGRGSGGDKDKGKGCGGDKDKDKGEGSGGSHPNR